MAARNSLVPVETIAQLICLIRSHKIMLDADLARLYGVDTKAFNRAIKRYWQRFPEDFMFQLTAAEVQNLRYQIGTSSWGGRRYRPYAFTEHGVAMLASVLRSRKAIEVNIAIIRAFVRLRQILETHKELAIKLCHVRRYERLLKPRPATFPPRRSAAAPVESQAVPGP